MPRSACPPARPRPCSPCSTTCCPEERKPEWGELPMAGGVQRAKLATSIAADPSERGAREENVMPYVQANGIHIYYEDHGSGAPMLLIHGGCSDATFWGSAVDELGRLGASLPTTGAAAAEPSGRS